MEKIHVMLNTVVGPMTFSGQMVHDVTQRSAIQHFIHKCDAKLHVLQILLSNHSSYLTLFYNVSY